MRFLLKVNIPVEAGNAAAKAGKLGTTIQSILAELKPEAAYFTDNNGQRTGFIVLEMQDASQIPAIAEPWTRCSPLPSRDHRAAWCTFAMSFTPYKARRPRRSTASIASDRSPSLRT